MKISTNKIKKMAKSVIRGEKHYGEHLMMSPVRDWYIGLTVFVILGIAGVIWAGATFLEHKNTAEQQAAQPVDIEVYKKGVVAAALKDLEERKARYDVIEKRLTSGLGSVSTITEVVPLASTTAPKNSTSTASTTQRTVIDDTPATEPLSEGEAEPSL